MIKQLCTHTHNNTPSAKAVRCMRNATIGGLCTQHWNKLEKLQAHKEKRPALHITKVAVLRPPKAVSR